MRRLAFVSMLTFALGGHAGEAEQVFAQVRGTVVGIDTLDEQGRPESQGSGVVIATEAIITNCHVVEDAQRIRVTWQGKTLNASLKRVDLERDLCLLAAPGLSAKPVALRKRGDLRVGEAAYAVGNPLGFELSVSTGLVSALPGPERPPLIHTSSPVSPGSSGGGLFDAQGRLIGITTSVFRNAQNFNTALPADWVQELLASQAPLPPEPPLPAPDPDWEGTVQQLTTARDWQGLRTLAQRYLAAFPSSAKARFFLGAAADQLGEKAAALRHYQEALAQDPHLHAAWRNQAMTLLSLQRFGEAGKAARKALELGHDQDALAWAIVGEAAFRADQLDTARAAFEQAVRLFPGEPAYWTWLGQIQARQGRNEAAETSYRKALRLNPKDLNSRNAQAELRLRSGKAPEVELGRAQGAAVVPSMPGDPPARMRQGIQALLAQAEEATRNGRLAEAEQAWRAAADQDANSAEAWIGLGSLQLKLGYIDAAEASLRKAVTLNPQASSAWTQLALAHTQAGRFREAEEAWWQVTRLNPGDAGAWIALAGTRAQQGNYQGQNSALKQAVTLAPENAQAWAWLANARLRLGREDAVEAAERALKLDPGTVEAMNVLASFHGRKGQYDKALAYADKVIALQPGDPIAWNNKGYTLLKMGKKDHAVKAFETAIRLNPELPASWINLGEARLRQGQMALAIQSLQKAITLSPRAVDARLYLAEAYLSTLQPGAAREHLNAAIQTQPKHPLAWERLTEMHLALGEKAEAQRALDRLTLLDATAAEKLRGRVKGKAAAGKQ